MKEGVYLLTHGGVVPGRERLVPSLFKDSIDFWRGHGDVTTGGPYFLTPGSGPRDHMAFVSMYRGNLDRLHQIITSRDFERMWAVTAQVTKNLSGRLYGGGTPEEIREIMSGAEAAWAKLGQFGA